MEQFIEVLGRRFFLQFCVPLITVGLTVFLRIASRNDRYPAFKKGDVAVGMDVAATALILFVVDCSRLALRAGSAESPADEQALQKLAAFPWTLAAFVIGMWGVSTLVRKFGWHSEKEELTVIGGIIIPGVFGILALVFVVSWMGR